ncbi:MAG: hypothetical protein LBF79_05535 [Dysgonamonadaceae bacterium]|jgi:hypothetical protein|nr:hypothetical protein [Dysgonamonadaceae bacterium]
MDFVLDEKILQDIVRNGIVQHIKQNTFQTLDFFTVEKFVDVIISIYEKYDL